MFPARRHHFNRCAEMKLASTALLQVLLAQERQCADALYNVVLLPVLATRVVDCRTRNDGKAARGVTRHGKLIEVLRKEFRHMRVVADGNQAFRQSAEFLAPES